MDSHDLLPLFAGLRLLLMLAHDQSPSESPIPPLADHVKVWAGVHAAWMEENAHMYPSTHPPTYLCTHIMHTHTYTRARAYAHTHTPGVAHNRFSSAVQFPFLELGPWHTSLTIAVQKPTE